jgi:hypothetical protein
MEAPPGASVSDFMSVIRWLAHEFCAGHLQDGPPRVLGRDICPQKYKQDSHDYIASGPRDVRRPCPALPFLVRLPDDVAHDVPPCVASGIQRLRVDCAAKTQATSLVQILIVLNRWDATARAVIHPFEIAAGSEANLSG